MRVTERTGGILRGKFAQGVASTHRSLNASEIDRYHLDSPTTGPCFVTKRW